MTVLGDKGCGFEHQLASIVARARRRRRTGARTERRLPAPRRPAGDHRSQQRGRLLGAGEHVALLAQRRPAEHRESSGTDRELSLQRVRSPLRRSGRCGVDLPHRAAVSTPADAQVTASGPTLDLTDCESNDSHGMLTSVKSLVKGIRALKADPDNQIVVGAIVAPPTPYTVAWVPEQGGQNPQPGEPGRRSSTRAVRRAATTSTRPASRQRPQLRRSGGANHAVGAGVRRQRCHGVDLRRQLCERVQCHREQDRRHLPGGSGADAGTVDGRPSALPIGPNGINPA